MRLYTILPMLDAPYILFVWHSFCSEMIAHLYLSRHNMLCLYLFKTHNYAPLLLLLLFHQHVNELLCSPFPRSLSYPDGSSVRLLPAGAT